MNCPPFSHKQFARYTKGIPNIKSIIGRSPDNVRHWRTNVDVYFDDSMHHNPYFKANLYFWLQHMKPGGIMCGHDYCAAWPDVCAEVNKLGKLLETKAHVEEWVWSMEIPNRIPLRCQLEGMFES